ncbi:MAG: hypothetical protein KJ922_02260, partial [Nanoarchaeota archaeon]|nr:hypothetical protein [Nanoarchaeota archaeon]
MAEVIGRDLVEILDVAYIHLSLSDGASLYLAPDGAPLEQNLLPENWYDHEWLKDHAKSLPGTSCARRVETKPVEGRSLDIVIRNSRVGQETPSSDCLLDDITDWQFNSPFEEFQLLNQLRSSRDGATEVVHTQKPYGIFVPPGNIEPWQMGRKQSVFSNASSRMTNLELDIHKEYYVVYGWIDGLDATQVGMQPEQIKELTLKVDSDLASKGFKVGDRKPHHIIVRPQIDGTLLKKGDHIVYAIIDYELLTRTEEYLASTSTMTRRAYHERQAMRFAGSQHKFPDNLAPINILGVDYVCGKVPSTGGTLFVVGKDPRLFDYFLPERWRRTPSIRLSQVRETYKTITKDGLNFVWRQSRVGEVPNVSPDDEKSLNMLEFGYNSPFEEVKIALDLARNGANTIYPRAIYRTGHTTEVATAMLDDSRYKSHSQIVCQD